VIPNPAKPARKTREPAAKKKRKPCAYVRWRSVPGLLDFVIDQYGTRPGPELCAEIKARWGLHVETASLNGVAQRYGIKSRRYGLTGAMLARECGISVPCMNRTLLKLGGPAAATRSERRHRIIPDELAEQVRAHYRKPAFATIPLKEAAKRLHYHRDAIMNMVARGELKAARVGRTVHICATGVSNILMARQRELAIAGKEAR
jgi:excisionase family DNA binding protein